MAHTSLTPQSSDIRNPTPIFLAVYYLGVCVWVEMKE